MRERERGRPRDERHSSEKKQRVSRFQKNRLTLCIFSNECQKKSSGEEENRRRIEEEKKIEQCEYKFGY